MIGKRRSAHYQSARSADWIKLKCKQRQAFVIGGYTRAQGARTGLGALLLGVFDASGALRHAGKVGTGFTEQDLLMLSRALKALDRHTSPFAGSPGSSAGVGARTSANRDGVSRWVEPTLVADVSFAEWTRAGRIRHAVFRGLRKDQKVGEIVQEKPSAVPAGKLSKTTSRTHKAAAAPPPPPRPPPPPTVFPSGLKISHPERVIDASSGSSKIDLLRYYGRVGDLMIKHLLGRPVSWLRAPTGIDGPLFFQKHSETQKLPGIHPLDPALNPGHPALITVASVQGLLWAAQWNVIEFHTPNCSAAAFEHPDRLVFDLDPGAGVAWQQVQEAAQLVRAFLSQLGLNSFLKTSGGKGLHVVVPLRRLHTWATVKGFSQAVVQHMAKAIPQRFVGRSGPRNRVGKIFIDALRNGLGATTVSAWSARARPGLGISVPVAWSELPVLRSGDHWTLKTVHERLATGNAPWQGYARAARGLDAAMSALGYVPAPVPAPVR